MKITSGGFYMLAALVLASSSCGGGSSTTATGASPSTLAATSTATAIASSAASTTQTATETTTSPVPSTSSSVPALNPSSTGKRLTLADFFQPGSYWSENRFDVADKGQIQGISHVVNSCSEGDPEILELRLRNYFKTLDFSVGQDNNSQGSDQVLMVAIYGNGAQVDIKRVPFNKVQVFNVPVQDVNALQMRFFLDRKVEGCGRKTANVVVYDVKLNS